MLDRHYLYDIESHVSIASLVIIDEEAGTRLTDYGNDYIQLILARDCNLVLNFRELPVALLRLHFTGKDRFMSWFTRIPHWDKSKLDQLARQDNRYDEGAENPSLAYILFLIDMCFCSFERTLCHFIQSPSDWPSFGFEDALTNDSYWQNVPVHECKMAGENKSFIIWYVILWRLHVSRMIERYIRPWRLADAEQEEWVTYRMRLFRDTHLDLLTMMIHHRLYDDEKLVESQHFYEHYPNAHRVCCAEELPCLVGYTFDNFKTGSNLKERCTLEDRIGHIFTNKPMPNICKVRNVHKIIHRYGKGDKVIFDLIKLVTRCVLLGNLPNTKGTMDLMARVRVNLSYWDSFADTPITRPVPVPKPVPKSKKPKTKKKKKDHDDEDEDDDDDGDDAGEEEGEFTLFTQWLYKCRHFVLFSLKEFLFYTAESSGCFDRILHRNNKWKQHKEIVRAGMGKCRDDISWQCKQATYDGAIDWNRIECIYKKDGYAVKTGIIMKVHVLLLKTTEKVRKDSFENILMKKMTSIEEKIKFTVETERKNGDGIDETIAVFMENNSAITLDELHKIGARMASRNKAIMETKWFQVVGMTPKGLSRLRDWIFCYYEYDIPDNALKDKIAAFQRESMNDYIILKTMIKVMLYYRRDYIYHLPSSYAVRQLIALRRLLCLDPLHPTPMLVGTHYMCPGCTKFANPVIDPTDYDTPVQEKDTVVIKHNKPVAVAATEPSVATEEGTLISDDEEEEEEEEDMEVAIRSTRKNRRGRKRRSKAVLRKMYANNEITTTKTEGVDTTTIQSSLRYDQTQLQHQYNVPYFNTALYDINTGQLHCRRNYKKKSGLLMSHASEKNYVIIEGKKNGLIVESTIDRSGEQKTELRSTLLTESESSGMDEDGDEENDMMTFNYEDELFFMPDTIGENEWDMANRLALNTGEQRPSEGHGHATPKKASNNKGIISRIVDAAFKQRFSCGTPLIEIDMVGVIIDGKALCCDCACMTEVTNRNKHSYGITCGRHATPSHASDHPVWQLDRFTVKQHAVHSELTRPCSATSGLSHTYRNTEDHCPAAVMDAKKRKKNQRHLDHFHPCDIVQHPSEFNPVVCHFCGVMRAIVYIPVIDRGSLRLLKKEICYSCKHLCKNMIDAGNVRYLDEVRAHVVHLNAQDTF